MSQNLIVIAFDTEDKAEEVLETMRSSEKHGFLNLEDSVVVKKDADGKVHSKNAMDKTTKEGIVAGGLLGMFLTAFFFGPVGWLGAALIGGAAGGGIGALMKKGVERDFIKDVSETIQPGTSALFLVVRSANADVAVAALRQYEGKILQSTLPEDAEETLERALRPKNPSA
ncbi:MAG: DUF1269 domain-containing protein [Ardenticatenaceae bacterium]|nr:DUF1269 domain-containing protein [Anaerolineales bacterium]MCB8984387.1 DUF1269 domain-containing protein [Ardenticatenaceae bacterium]